MGGDVEAMAIAEQWTPAARHAVAGSFLGWTLDAFDFFILTFVLPDIATQFHVGIPQVALAITITLALRPLGAFIFGRLADRFGRRNIFILNIALYSLFGFLTAFAPDLQGFFVIRALFGVAMGGIWGVGASLAFETIPTKARGFVSGLMQAGYSTGYLFAALALGFFYTLVGWRGLFMLGAIPALLLIVYFWTCVEESPAFEKAKGAQINLGTLALQVAGICVLLGVAYELLSTFGLIAAVPIAVVAIAAAYILSPFVRRYWPRMLFAVTLMTAFTFFSHGTQDIYPVFLQKQHGFGHATVSAIAVVYNIGAVLGGILFGSLSQRFGRRRTIITAALLALPVTALWAFSTTALMLGIGAFAMQFFVQGAWGVVPAHLNELSPPGARATFPGTVYQLGNLIASVNAVLQTSLAERSGGNYAIALASVAVCAALAISLTVWLGPEAQNVAMRD
jgi:SHS family lactate transporter-like MFS transporter